MFDPGHCQEKVDVLIVHACTQNAGRQAGRNSLSLSLPCLLGRVGEEEEEVNGICEKPQS